MDFLCAHLNEVVDVERLSVDVRWFRENLVLVEKRIGLQARECIMRDRVARRLTMCVSRERGGGELPAVFDATGAHF